MALGARAPRLVSMAKSGRVEPLEVMAVAALQAPRLRGVPPGDVVLDGSGTGGGQSSHVQ